MLNKKLITILGSTGSGKSSLTIKLAQEFNGEIISADSRQIYKHMDIGTNKDLGKINKIKNKNFVYYTVLNIPIYMFDVVMPDQDFSLFEYKKHALNFIDFCLHKGKTPFLVGGTGLYIKSINENLIIPECAPDKKLRKDLEIEIAEKGIDKVYKKLLKIDPKAENIVQENNSRRIIRALEVCIKTKKPFSSLQKKGEILFNPLKIGIKVERDKLYKRIDNRVKKMIKMGLIQETQNLIEKGYSFSLPSMSGIGYKEIGMYLRKECSLEKAIELICFRTHQYARRQMTWFKKDKTIKWTQNYTEAQKLVKEFLFNK